MKIIDTIQPKKLKSIGQVSVGHAFRRPDESGVFMPIHEVPDGYECLELSTGLLQTIRKACQVEELETELIIVNRR